MGVAGNQFYPREPPRRQRPQKLLHDDAGNRCDRLVPGDRDFIGAVAAVFDLAADRDTWQLRLRVRLEFWLAVPGVRFR